jgi:hypothetical protein
MVPTHQEMENTLKNLLCGHPMSIFSWFFVVPQRPTSSAEAFGTPADLDRRATESDPLLGDERFHRSMG